jgi:hypothetical protein
MRVRESILSLAVATFVVGCGKDEPKTPTPAPAPATQPPPASGNPMPPAAAPHESHDASHGGRVLELGDHEGHLELVHDAAAGTVTVYVTDADMKPVASEAPVINLTKGTVQVPMTPLSGDATKADAWKATHDALKATPLDGRIRVKIGERTYNTALENK